MPNRKPYNKVFCLTSGLSGGIAVLQLYGPKSLDILKQIFLPLKQDFTKISQLPISEIFFGHIRDTAGETIDEAIVRRLRPDEMLCLPESFHICCHGGPATVAKLTSVFAAICVPMMTLSIFLEDLRNAKNIDASTIRILNRFPDASTDLMGKVLLNALSHKPILAGTGISLRRNTLITKLLNVPPVIVLYGKTNSGKSTLMNVMSSEGRSIVASQAGTTRDSIIKHMSVGGILMQLIDTAGIMNAKSKLTRLSIRQSMKYLKKADLILLIYDVSKKDTGNDLLRNLTQRQKTKTILVANKIDLLSCPEKGGQFLPKISLPVIYISALKKTGITELKKLILLKLGVKFIKRHSHFQTSRHNLSILENL
ncbi:MAG: GTP-binding protein [Planctomycetes bacterium]|nr:GTP-binding protein [Planctomycetota bacterium]